MYSAIEHLWIWRYINVVFYYYYFIIRKQFAKQILKCNLQYTSWDHSRGHHILFNGKEMKNEKECFHPHLSALFSPSVTDSLRAFSMARAFDLIPSLTP